MILSWIPEVLIMDSYNFGYNCGMICVIADKPIYFRIFAAD